MKHLLTLSISSIWLLVSACGHESPAPSKLSSAPTTKVDSLQGPNSDSTIMPSHADTVQVAIPDKQNDMNDAEVKSPASVAPSRSPAPVPHSATPTNNERSIAQNGFADVAALDPNIILDIRYATADNFTKSKIYDCPRCLLRPEAAEALVKAQKTLQKKGFGLKMFDCYRPRPYQQRLWDKVPNPDYVTPPAKGSMHSRGAAVDLTIVDLNGKELDMGTPYDFFGKEAHTDNTSLPAQVLANRRLLQETLAAVGFKGIRTEWWHFSFQGKNYPLSDYVWPCERAR